MAIPCKVYMVTVIFFDTSDHDEVALLPEFVLQVFRVARFGRKETSGALKFRKNTGLNWLNFTKIMV